MCHFNPCSLLNEHSMLYCHTFSFPHNFPFHSFIFDFSHLFTSDPHEMNKGFDQDSRRLGSLIRCHCCCLVFVLFVAFWYRSSSYNCSCVVSVVRIAERRPYKLVAPKRLLAYSFSCVPWCRRCQVFASFRSLSFRLTVLPIAFGYRLLSLFFFVRFWQTR